MKVVRLFLFAAAVLVACSKDCGTPQGACADVVPTGELCLAAFNRWFYNAANNRCEQISYSGCNQKGFASQAECEACKCK